MKTNEKAIHIIKDWVDKHIIGLNLCPFAHKPFKKNTIRYRMYEGSEILPLSELLVEEGRRLLTEDPDKVETTLIVLPEMFEEFELFWSYCGMMEEIFTAYQLEGFIQLVGFHPGFRFEGSEVNDPGNFTNRSPFPMIHLIKESSVSEAVDQYPDVHNIPAINQEKLNQIGFETLSNRLLEWQEQWKHEY